MIFVVAAAPLWAEQTADERPNIVIVFCDDLGYADVGVNGAKGYTTPNIDRLAAEGINFARFYSAQPVCSASRAGLLTGCYPNRIGIHGALGPRAKVGMHADETTLAEVLKKQGYATAVFGKWHLGREEQFLPLQHGFDEYFGLPYSNEMWPYHPGFVNLPPERAKREGFPDLPLIEGNQVVIPAVSPEDQSQLTTWYTEHAVSFIERNKEKPFFLYVPLFEHQAVVLADAAIAEQLGQPSLDALCRQLTDSLRGGTLPTALCATIATAGEQLAKFLPRQTDNVNELPDALVILDTAL